jgi:hypothetical protein
LEGLTILNSLPFTVPDDVKASAFQRQPFPDRSTIDVLASVAVTAHSLSPSRNAPIHSSFAGFGV